MFFLAKCLSNSTIRRNNEVFTSNYCNNNVSVGSFISYIKCSVYLPEFEIWPRELFVRVFAMYCFPIYIFKNGTFLSFFVGICLHQDTLYKYFKTMVREMDEMNDSEQRKLTLQMVKLVRFHNLVKE